MILTFQLACRKIDGVCFLVLVRWFAACLSVLPLAPGSQSSWQATASRRLASWGLPSLRRAVAEAIPPSRQPVTSEIMSTSAASLVVL
ncbi:hypothetical protein ElyMa_004521400 [Elysia marginata]|uniref:Secreted protein n=1 Tax=Elysia marginata TaxID=1093978 RepID=A0AAV4HMQ6_9GAST|nr:hypothetical protein ElyMa_004521400 [Elysia marginata]